MLFKKKSGFPIAIDTLTQNLNKGSFLCQDDLMWINLIIIYS